MVPSFTVIGLFLNLISSYHSYGPDISLDLFVRPGPRSTLILKVGDYLNFKLEKYSLRKAIFISYSESQFLRVHTGNVHGVLSNRVCFCKLLLTHKIFDRKVQVIRKFKE